MTSTDLMPAVVFSTPARKHEWRKLPAVYLAAADSPDGNGRTERPCSLCGLRKITVHGAQGFPWREWRTAAGKVWTGEATPPCLEGVRQDDSEN